MVEESKLHVAKKLKMTPEFIIPLENLLKVEDLERVVTVKDQIIAEKDQEIAENEQEIAEKNQKLAEKNQKLAEKDQEISKLKALLQSSHKNES